MSSNNLHDKLHQAHHGRKDSLELDVFEAARYFSGGIDDDRGGGCRSGGPCEEERAEAMKKKSSEKATLSTSPENKCIKQSLSPSWRLASFLNLFLHQAASKKKFKSLTKDEGEENHGGKKRRESMTSISSNSIYAIRTNVHEDSSSYPNKQCNGKPKYVAFCPQIEPCEWESEFLWNGWLEKGAKIHGIAFVGRDKGFCENRWVLKSSNGGDVLLKRKSDEFISRERKGSFDHEEREGESGGESDSSSDLFELKNYNLGDLSSDLPVYGTTKREIIKMEAAL